MPKSIKRIIYGFPVLFLLVLASLGIWEYYVQENFSYESIEISPENPALMQQVEITVDVKNHSLKSKTYNIELFVNGNLLETKREEFSFRQLKPVTFVFTEDTTPGEHQFSAGDISTQVNIEHGAQPNLQVGDEWNYNLTRSGLQHSVREVITEETSIRGEPCWLRRTTYNPALDLRFDVKEECTIKDNIFPIRSEFTGTVSRQTNNYSYDISGGADIFPLTPGQTIISNRVLEQETVLEDTGVDTQETTESTVSITVLEPETVIVPAGEFEALKLEYRNSQNQLFMQEWRAAEVKLNVVRSINLGTGEEWLLESYDLED